MKTIDEHFIDWESHVFGYGYGTGEPHVMAALKAFLGVCPESGPYDYEALERALTPQVAWLLINTLCRAGIVNYGPSPRFGWLEHRTGVALKAYVAGKTVAELCDVLANRTESTVECFPDHCNCVDAQADMKTAVKACGNPFWEPRQ